MHDAQEYTPGIEFNTPKLSIDFNLLNQFSSLPHDLRLDSNGKLLVQEKSVAQNAFIPKSKQNLYSLEPVAESRRLELDSAAKILHLDNSEALAAYRIDGEIMIQDAALPTRLKRYLKPGAMTGLEALQALQKAEMEYQYAEKILKQAQAVISKFLPEHMPTKPTDIVVYSNTQARGAYIGPIYNRDVVLLGTNRLLTSKDLESPSDSDILTVAHELLHQSHQEKQGSEKYLGKLSMFPDQTTLDAESWQLAQDWLTWSQKQDSLSMTPADKIKSAVAESFAWVGESLLKSKMGSTQNEGDDIWQKDGIPVFGFQGQNGYSEETIHILKHFLAKDSSEWPQLLNTLKDLDLDSLNTITSEQQLKEIVDSPDTLLL